MRRFSSASTAASARHRICPEDIPEAPDGHSNADFEEHATIPDEVFRHAFLSHYGDGLSCGRHRAAPQSEVFNHNFSRPFIRHHEHHRQSDESWNLNTGHDQHNNGRDLHNNPCRPVRPNTLPPNFNGSCRPDRLGSPRSAEDRYTWPSISQSGNYSVWDSPHLGVYVDPEYATFNPQNHAHEKPKAKPVWGLANPLPRVVRPGMRKRKIPKQDQPRKQSHQKGEQEIVPQSAHSYRPCSSHSQDVGQIHIPDDRSSTDLKLEILNEYLADPPGWCECTLGDDRLTTPPAARDISSFQSAPPLQGERPLCYGNNHDFKHSPHRYATCNQPCWPQDHRNNGIDADHCFSVESDCARARGEEAEPEFLTTWSKYRHRIRAPLAEWLAVYINLTINLCAAQAWNTSNAGHGDYVEWQFVTFARGFSSMIAIYIAGGVSGAHLSPAVSIMLAIFRGFPWRDCLIYTGVQFLGSLAAAGTACSIYRDAMHHIDPDRTIHISGKAIISHPRPWVSPATAFFTNFIAAFINGVSLLALGDDSNSPPTPGMNALIIGLAGSTVGSAFGYNSGGLVNPFVEISSRIVLTLSGYDPSELWLSHHAYWLWASIVGPLIGILVGALAYDLFIFVGGESPVNYPRTRGKRTWLKLEYKYICKLLGRHERARSLERDVEKAT